MDEEGHLEVRPQAPLKSVVTLIGSPGETSPKSGPGISVAPQMDYCPLSVGRCCVTKKSVHQCGYFPREVYNALIRKSNPSSIQDAK